jgi:hypothetical protein
MQPALYKQLSIASAMPMPPLTQSVARPRRAFRFRPDGMAECDGAAVDVQFLTIEMQLAVARQYLGSECFIQFDQIRVAETETVFLFDFADRRHRPDAAVQQKLPDISV